MSARHRHAKDARRAWMQVKTDWGNAKMLPRSLYVAMAQQFKTWRLMRRRSATTVGEKP